MTNTMRPVSQRRVNFPLDDPRFDLFNAYLARLDADGVKVSPIIAELALAQFTQQMGNRGSFTPVDLPMRAVEPVLEDTDPDELGDALGASW